MLFNYFNLVSEVLACIFSAIGACAVILPIAGFLAFVALGHSGMILILGLMAAIMAAIMAAVAVFVEIAQAVEEVRDFRRWRAAVKNA